LAISISALLLLNGKSVAANNVLFYFGVS